MRLGAQTGTGTGLSVPYVKVATKTGTAEVGNTKSYVNSSAMGFFPYDNPEYVFIVLMEHGPRTNLIGGVSVMRQLLDYMRFNTPEYFGLPPIPERVEVPIQTPPVETPAETPITQPNEIDPQPDAPQPTDPQNLPSPTIPAPTPVGQ
jgi:hypothetical protein